ncbi:hypothetical protein VTI74DRAFT_441 [Chaetomium olivicolor]
MQVCPQDSGCVLGLNRVLSCSVCVPRVSWSLQQEHRQCVRVRQRCPSSWYRLRAVRLTEPTDWMNTEGGVSDFVTNKLPYSATRLPSVAILLPNTTQLPTDLFPPSYRSTRGGTRGLDLTLTCEAAWLGFRDPSSGGSETEERPGARLRGASC